MSFALRRCCQQIVIGVNFFFSAGPAINIWRVKSRVESGGHDVPEEKVIVRYDRALALIKDVVKVCDVCHIYDNSGNQPFRIFKKGKVNRRSCQEI